MCALMGSSGDVRTVFRLLDVLARRKTTGVTTGNITYNGSTQLSSFAYVMQDDVHIGSLTVLETISFAAELRLPQNLPADVKKKRVQQLINMMMLGDVSDRIIGGEYARCISGGELKRLSIVVEIVLLPDLMFLDEPTTGLDSSTALEVVSGLRNIANQHRTIICTIHQPSQEIFQLFDIAMVLSDLRSRETLFAVSDRIPNCRRSGSSGLHHCCRQFQHSRGRWAMDRRGRASRALRHHPAGNSDCCQYRGCTTAAS